MTSSILCNLSDANALIIQARDEWLDEVFINLGVPDEVKAHVENVQAYRMEMYALGIEADLKANGEINVYKKRWHTGETEEQSGWLDASDQDLVAQWKTPERIRRVEGKSVYYEIKLNEWSIKKR